MIQEKTPFPVIIAGDFNFEPSNSIYSKIISLNYDDLWQHMEIIPTTYCRGLEEFRCVDYIAWTPNFISFQDGKSGGELLSSLSLSDHLYLECELRTHIDNLEIYEKQEVLSFRDIYFDNFDTDHLLSIITRFLQEMAALKNIPIQLKSRRKSVDSINNKSINCESIKLLQMMDIFGISIIIDYKDFDICYIIMEHMQTLFTLVKYTDYIKSPMKTFQGILCDFENDGIIFEIFLFTLDMYTMNIISNRMSYNHQMNKIDNSVVLIHCQIIQPLYRDYFHEYMHEYGIKLYLVFNSYLEFPLQKDWCFVEITYESFPHFVETNIQKLNIDQKIINNYGPHSVQMLNNSNILL
jgi:hypothetical protein